MRVKPGCRPILGPAGKAPPHQLPPTAAAPADPVSLSRGTKVGALGLDLTTRRRNRVNGTVTSVDADGTVVLQVDQAFGK